MPVPIPKPLRTISRVLFSLVFPDECRVCGCFLEKITRYPVCYDCVHNIQPLVSGHFCRLCRTPFISETSLDSTGSCWACQKGTRGFDEAYCFGGYEGALRELILLLKYARVRSLAAPLGLMLLRALPRDLEFDCVVPVPMHWSRRWSRGFNHAESIARVLARRTGVRLSNALIRRRRTPAQAGLTAAQRRLNVTRAFRVSKRAGIEGRRILLVDDVFTTGATARACAAALTKAGAKSVVLLTLAHVDNRLVETSAGEKLPGAS